MKLFELALSGTIDLDRVSAIYAVDSGSHNREWYAVCDGHAVLVPNRPDRLVDDLFEAWENRAKNPRTHLRECWVKDYSKAYFHEWTRDADGEPTAIIEDENGTVQSVNAWLIRFTDGSKED